MNATLLPRLQELSEADRLKGYHRLGLLNGLLVGLALAIGAWGMQLTLLRELPTTNPYGSILLASALVLILTTLTGWLTARIGRGIVTLPLWLLAAVLVTLIIGFQGNRLRSLAVWLADRRFWGLSIFPLEGVLLLSLVAAGFFVVLVLAILAVLQDYRLEGVQGAMAGHLMNLRAVILLLLPLPVVALAAFITNGENRSGGGSSALALQQVHEAIRTGRTYEGDLFQLSREEGVNYNAIRGVRDQMGDTYTLAIAGIDIDSVTTFVVAHFDNGAWINCRVINDQLSFCYDASVPYTDGFARVIAGLPRPEDCRGCMPRVDPEWQSWLEDRAQRFGADPPMFSRVAQQGSYVIMRAESAAGDYRLECTFGGTSPTIMSCSEISS